MASRAIGKEVVEKDIATKHAKMADGPFPFLRATYWRWAETILDVCPEFANAPSVLAVGDIHLENYGTWRDVEGRLIWGVNDFDEAAEMPYALDLVRLGTSAMLGCPHFDTRAEMAADILRGYERGLADPRPVVLDHDFGWLRRLVVVPNKERQHFWDKMNALKPEKKPPPGRYLRTINDEMPEPKLKITYARRTAGAGSLGRPRYVGLAEWRGAPVVREAKAALPSAWTRVKGRGAKTLRCYEIATGDLSGARSLVRADRRCRGAAPVAEQPQARRRDASARADGQEDAARDGARSRSRSFGVGRCPWRHSAGFDEAQGGMAR